MATKRKSSSGGKWDLESHKTDFESEEWNLRRRLMEVQKDKFPEDDDDFNGPATKYRELDTVAFRLDQFSDEVLFEIFKHLDSWTLLALMNSCSRFNNFVQDHRFWREIDLGKEPLPLGMLESVLERTHPKTQTIKLRGPSPAQHLDGEVQQFNKTFVVTLATRCTQLKVLELQGVTIDFRSVRIRDFPKTLKRLVLDDCHVRIPEPEVKSIFWEIDTHLLALEELGIENSDWFEPHYIMIFSKAPVLRWLSLRGCRNLSQFVPYGSMAARFGFKHLEYLDMRFTPITDSDLQCFNAVVTLKEILLEAPQDTIYLKNAVLPIELNTSDQPSTSGASSSSAAATVAKKTRKAARLSSIAKRSRKSLRLSRAQEGKIKSSLLASKCVRNRSKSMETARLQPPRNEPSTSSSSSSSSSLGSPLSSSSSSSPSSSPSHSGLSSPLAPAPTVGNGNMPDRSRLPPRPDKIIYLEIHNRCRPIIMSGPPRRAINQRAEHLNQVLVNPIFWDMVGPMGRRARRGAAVNNGDENDHEAASRLRYNRSELITDRGVCCFGRPPNPVDDAIIWIRIGYRPNENRFERLTVRNYRLVTDISLRHLVQCSPHLVFLDLSGTGVTRAGVQMFKERKPECQIIADHLTDPDEPEIEQI